VHPRTAQPNNVAKNNSETAFPTSQGLLTRTQNRIDRSLGLGQHSNQNFLTEQWPRRRSTAVRERDAGLWAEEVRLGHGFVAAEEGEHGEVASRQGLDDWARDAAAQA
jgi:hypothetical protein